MEVSLTERRIVGRRSANTVSFAQKICGTLSSQKERATVHAQWVGFGKADCCWNSPYGEPAAYTLMDPEACFRTSDLGPCKTSSTKWALDEILDDPASHKSQSVVSVAGSVAVIIRSGCLLPLR